MPRARTVRSRPRTAPAAGTAGLPGTGALPAGEDRTAWTTGDVEAVAAALRP